MKLTIKDVLANWSKIGPAVGELAWISEAESDQISIPQIAKGLRKTKRSVSMNLHRLESHGVIKITPISGKESRYEIVLGENSDAR